MFKLNLDLDVMKNKLIEKNGTILGRCVYYVVEKICTTFRSGMNPKSDSYVLP